MDISLSCHSTHQWKKIYKLSYFFLNQRKMNDYISISLNYKLIYPLFNLDFIIIAIAHLR